MDFLAQLQLPPSLPDDPVAAAVSWQALIFLVAAFLCLSAVVGVVLRTRSAITATVTAMVEKANKDVVASLDRLEASVREMSGKVLTLLQRDGVVDAAIQRLDARVSEIERKQDRASDRISQVEGRMLRGE